MQNLFGTFERFMQTHPLFGKSNFGNISMSTPMSTPMSSNKNKNQDLEYIILQDTAAASDMNTQLIQFTLIIIAVYLALKCKKNGQISMIEIIVAVLCAPFYIIYRFIKPCI